MKPFITFLVSILCLNISYGQQKNLPRITDSIEAEGKTLFKSEWASWYGGDAFLAKCPTKRNLLGGYLSYDTGKGLINILLSKGDEPMVLGTVDFGYAYTPNSYQLDTNARKMNSKELELFKLRIQAVKRMGSDTIFKNYKNASLNPIPIIIDGIKRVYVLTGPSVNGVVLIGNDYLMNFNKKDELTEVKKLHKGLIPFYTKKAVSDSAKTDVGGMHTHLPEYSEFITATDICTLMLYENMTTWQTHYVMSKNYVSIWDCKKNMLVIMTMEAWKKIDSGKSALDGVKN